MAGRWEDERGWRDHEARYGREPRDQDFGRPDGYRAEDRSFQGPRGPVFGERETGTNYAAPRGSDRGHGPTPGRFPSPIRGADRGYGPGHDEADRERAYRAAYGEDYDHPRGDYAGDEARYYRDSAERWDRDPRGPEPRNFLDRAADSVASWFAGDRHRDGPRPEAPRRDLGHRGLGPQGYKRPDERITEEAHERLTEDAWVDASNIAISVSGGEVTLSGTVTEREAKHRAERLVEDIAGVTHVQNNLRVDRGNFLTRPAAGFGDSVQAAQMKAADRRNDS